MARTKDSDRSYMRLWRSENPEANRATARRARLKANFGITPEVYRALEIAQQGECAVCGRVETSVSNFTKKVKRLAVDHNHQTGAIRALVCHACNAGMGNLGDDPIWLRQAALYLEVNDG